jgi:4-hydroxybenzoate polyprenyltransferase
LGELYSLEEDRKDPEKKNRTLAAGRLDLSRGGFISLGFMLAGLILAAFLGRSVFFLAFMIFILTYLKKHLFDKNRVTKLLSFPFINVFILAAGYPILNIPISLWVTRLAFFALGALGALEILSEYTLKLKKSMVYSEIDVKKLKTKQVNESSFDIMFFVTTTCVMLMIFIISRIMGIAIWTQTGEPDTYQNSVFIITRPNILSLIMPKILYFFYRLYNLATEARVTKPIFLFILTDWICWACYIAAFLVYLASGTLFI